MFCVGGFHCTAALVLLAWRCRMCTRLMSRLFDMWTFSSYRSWTRIPSNKLLYVCVCVWLCISPYKHDMMLGRWYRSCPLEVIFIMYLWLHGSYKHDSHTDLMECTERDKMSFYWVWSSSGRLLHTQCEIATMFGNVGNHLPVHTTRHPRKRLFSNMAGRTWNLSDIRAFDVKIC